MSELMLAALGMCGPLLYGQHRPLDLGTGTLKKWPSQDKPTLVIVRHRVSSLSSLLASQFHQTVWEASWTLAGAWGKRVPSSSFGTFVRYPKAWENSSSVTRYLNQGQTVPLGNVSHGAVAQSRSQFLGNNSAEDEGWSLNLTFPGLV